MKSLDNNIDFELNTTANFILQRSDSIDSLLTAEGQLGFDSGEGIKRMKYYNGAMVQIVATEADVEEALASYVPLSFSEDVTIDQDTNDLIFTNGKVGFGGTPSAQVQYTLIDDTNPPYIGAWDERHVQFGIGGATGKGLGISVSNAENEIYFAFLEPGLTWMKSRMNFLSTQFYSGGLTLGFEQASDASVTINKGLTIKDTSGTDVLIGRNFYNSAGELMGDFQNRFLYANNKVVLDWANGKLSLNDTDTTNVVNWYDSLLKDSAETTSVDWANRVLHDSSDNLNLDWEERKAYNVWTFFPNPALTKPSINAVTDVDGRGIGVIAYDDPSGTGYGLQLNVKQGGTSINNLSSYSDVNTADYDELGLMATTVRIYDDIHIGGYIIDGASEISIDTNNRELLNSSTSPSIDWENRILYGNWEIGGIAEIMNIKLAALNTAPSSASDTGLTGEIRIDSNHIYVCVATNTWKRSALSTW